MFPFCSICLFKGLLFRWYSICQILDTRLTSTWAELLTMLYYCVCFRVVRAGEPEAGERDEQPGGWSEVSPALHTCHFSGQHFHHCRMSFMSFYCDHKSVMWTGKWFTPGTALVLMCYTMSLPLPLNNYSTTATEMPDELDNNYVICQMWIQTGLKWPKDKGVRRQNDDFVWQRKSLTFVLNWTEV